MWTEAKIEKMKEMWAVGATASQIADELGGVSRNAVIGKAHRLGLDTRSIVEHVTFPEDWDEMGSRKTAFADIFMSLLEERGYTNPVSLKVKGAYAFEVTDKQGKQIKIGLKTAYDGWLNTAQVMVEKVDRVWVTAFTWDNDEPKSLRVYEISKTGMLALFDEIHAARTKAGRDNDYTYMPVLDETLKAYKRQKGDQYFLCKGAFEDHASLIYTAPLRFTNSVKYGIKKPLTPATSQPTKQNLLDPLQGVEDPVSLLKQLIAERNGTTVDKVEITVRI